MKYFMLLLSILCIIPSIVKGNIIPLAESDTVRLDELVVTGTMPGVTLRTLPLSVSVVGDNSINWRKSLLSPYLE